MTPGTDSVPVLRVRAMQVPRRAGSSPACRAAAGRRRVLTKSSTTTPGAMAAFADLLAYRFLLAMTIVVLIAPGVLVAQDGHVQDGSFTDSNGRTVLYRLRLRSGWDPSEPRGLLIFLHGANEGTADYIRRVDWVDPNDAFDLGLATAVLASPTSSWGPEIGDLFGRVIGGAGTRGWVTEDGRLVHELLQSGFNSTLAVNHDRIIFMGGSGGAGFLAQRFLEQYAGVYAGGFYLWCGSFWGPSPPVTHHTPPRVSTPWTPTYQWTPSGAPMSGAGSGSSWKRRRRTSCTTTPWRWRGTTRSCSDSIPGRACSRPAGIADAGPLGRGHSERGLGLAVFGSRSHPLERRQRCRRRRHAECGRSG